MPTKKPNKRRVALFIDPDLLAGLDALKAEHGRPIAESVRRAIVEYLARQQKGGGPKGPSTARTPRKPKRTR